MLIDFVLRLGTGLRATLLLVGTIWFVLAGRLHTPHDVGADQHCQVCALAAISKSATPSPGVPTLPVGRVIVLTAAHQSETHSDRQTVPDRARSPPVR